ncbi:hypothetical protein NADE_003008 [Nannochloris sp. 'desiccata']|nr:hypothetical protein KSW81_000935 [Chlorella desiccata (nom. nud.)]KAH7620384.1 hypothetical protein NADE_003008 [Chlorella desiccata (nom. nud.)]
MSLARLQQVASKAKAAAEPLYKVAREQSVKQYDNLMAKGADYVVKDKAAADKLLKQWFFTNLSRVPSEIAQAKQEATMWRGRLSQFSELPMATYAGFVAEVYAWFAIGEIIGRGGTLSGYNV